MDEDNMKKITGFIITIVVIAVMLPMFLRLNERMNNEIITVYEPTEVGNSNITLSSNFVNQIDVKESIQNESIFSNIYENLDNNSIIYIDSYSNASFDINCSIDSIVSNATLEVTEINNDINSSTTTNFNYQATNTTRYLYSSFTIYDNYLENITIRAGINFDAFIYLSILNSSFNPQNGTLIDNNYIVYNISTVGFIDHIAENEDLEVNICTISNIHQYLDSSLTQNGLWYLRITTNGSSLLLCYDTTTSNSIDWSRTPTNIYTLRDFDFTINYTFGYQNNSLKSVLIDEFEYNMSDIEFDSINNSFRIQNISIINDNISIILQFYTFEVLYNSSIDIIFYSDYWNNIIDNISISQILLISNASKLALFSSNNTNISIFTIFDQNISSILLFSSATNRYINVVLPNNITIEVGQNYDFIIKDIEVFVDSFKLELDVYQNNILVNSYNATSSIFYPAYSF